MNITAVLESNPVVTWEQVMHLPRRKHLELAVTPSAASRAPAPQWVEGLTRSVVEVLAGRRPAGSLVAALSPAVYDALRSATALTPLEGGVVRTARCQSVGDEAVEVAAVVSCPQRTRALTMRLAHRRGSWRCVCLAVL
jgi:hypothetical protein